MPEAVGDNKAIQIVSVIYSRSVCVTACRPAGFSKEIIFMSVKVISNIDDLKDVPDEVRREIESLVGGSKPDMKEIIGVFAYALFAECIEIGLCEKNQDSEIARHVISQIAYNSFSEDGGRRIGLLACADSGYLGILIAIELTASYISNGLRFVKDITISERLARVSDLMLGFDLNGDSGRIAKERLSNTCMSLFHSFVCNSMRASIEAYDSHMAKLKDEVVIDIFKKVRAIRNKYWDDAIDAKAFDNCLAYDLSDDARAELSHECNKLADDSLRPFKSVSDAGLLKCTNKRLSDMIFALVNEGNFLPVHWQCERYVIVNRRALSDNIYSAFKATSNEDMIHIISSAVAMLAGRFKRLDAKDVGKVVSIALSKIDPALIKSIPEEKYAADIEGMLFPELECIKKMREDVFNKVSEQAMSIAKSTGGSNV